MEKTTNLDLADYSYKLILHAGNARTAGDMAIQDAKKGDFDQAKIHMQEAHDELDLAHQIQTSLLTINATDGCSITPDFLLVHAANHYAATDSYLLLCQEFIELYQRLEKAGK
jgi:PTS system cellobiose-specific IIA component